MSFADILKEAGSGLATGAKAVGAVLEPVAKRTAEVVSGEAPQIDEEQRQNAQRQGEQATEAKSQQLESQLEMGRKYGTLNPDQQKQYVDAITQLYSHPSQMSTLVSKLHKMTHPNGATYQAAPLTNATPKGGTAAADEQNAEKLAGAKQSTKPLPKDAAFLESFAREKGKTWDQLTPDEMIEAFNKEGETKAAQDKETHQKSLEDYRNSIMQLRKSEEALHEAQFKVSQDPNNPKYKLDAEKARTTAMRDEAYWIRAQASVFGEVNGKPAAGAMTTGTGQTIGSMFSPGYRTSQQAMAQLNDAGGSVKQVSDSLGKLYGSGASLNDPNVAEALAHHEWTTAQLAQGIVGKTLSPEQRDAVTAIVSARENIQGMRKAAGGGLSNEQVNRLEAQLPGPNTPNPEYAKRQLDLLNQTLQRLSEGVPVTVGGSTFKWEPDSTTGAQNVGKSLAPSAGAKPVNSSPKSAIPKIQHQVGDKKTFPNGRTGVWDGTGWVAQ
jgi:hypothetical protein